MNNWYYLWFVMEKRCDCMKMKSSTQCTGIKWILLTTLKMFWTHFIHTIYKSKVWTKVLASFLKRFSLHCCMGYISFESTCNTLLKKQSRHCFPCKISIMSIYIDFTTIQWSCSDWFAVFSVCISLFFNFNFLREFKSYVWV